MRILQVSSARQLGGGETHVLELTEALRSAGHDVVLAGRPAGAVAPQVQLPFRNSADLLTALRLRGILKRERFEVVHAHVARDYTVVCAAAVRLPVKVVLTRHLLYPVRAHGLYRRVDGWLAPTRQILKTLDPLHPKQAVVIPNWVDPRKFLFHPHALHDPVHVGLLGQISPHKGHDDAIEAMRHLGSGYKLVIAGKGEESYVSALKQRAGALPIEFAGFVSLPDFFSLVDILLVPSWEEPFGIVLLEAMASGVPVIATAAGGPLDIIRTNVDGILVPPRNPAALAAAVRELTVSDRRSEIIRSARTRVETDFDIRTVVPRIAEFYRRLCGESQFNPES